MKTVLIALFAVVAFAGFANAQFQENDWTLTLSGGGSVDKDFNDGFVNATVTVSHFLTDGLELGMVQSVSYNDNFNGLTGFFLNYNFDLEDSNFVPFVGVNAGYSYGYSVSDAWRVGPQVGGKYFVNTTTYLYGQVGYEFDLNDGFDSGGFVYGMGIGFRF